MYIIYFLALITCLDEIVHSIITLLINFVVNSNSSKAFDGLLQLLRLDLSTNNIATVPTDAFNGLVSLRSLDLSFNQLKKLDNKTNGVLENCLSLEKVHTKFSKA